MQDRKSAFLNGPTDRKTVSPDRLANPASRYVVQAGAVIRAALVTGIHYDLPGQVAAQATEKSMTVPPADISIPRDQSWSGSMTVRSRSGRTGCFWCGRG